MWCFDCFLYSQMTYSYYNLRLLLIDLFPYDAAEGSTQVDIERNSTLERYQSSESSVETLPNSTPPTNSTSGHNDSSTCPMCYEEYTNGAEIRRYLFFYWWIFYHGNRVIRDQKTVNINLICPVSNAITQNIAIITIYSDKLFFSIRL